jgi:hypothetical protein
MRTVNCLKANLTEIFFAKLSSKIQDDHHSRDIDLWDHTGNIFKIIFFNCSENQDGQQPMEKLVQDPITKLINHYTKKQFYILRHEISVWYANSSMHR